MINSSTNKADELSKKYSEMEMSTTPKLYFEAALSEIDYHFNEGDITQREWAKLYSIISEWAT